MKFSLVTTCRNEMRSLGRWKQNLIEQTRQPDEIVIVDAFSNDGTAEELFAWAKADPRVKIFQEKGAAANGRNFAIEKASFDHIVSTDMGVRLVPEWFAELTRPFEDDPSVELVIGNTCIDTESLVSAAARAEFYQENGGIANPGPGAVGGNRSSAYLKRIWRECGGLPEDLTFYADDSTFFRQLNEHGYKTAYAWGAMTLWGRSAKLKQFWKEAWNYGRGDGEAFIKEPWAFRQYRQKRVFWWAALMLNGLRVVQKRCSAAAFG
ncbi:MAG: glycosyltransferase, partial [Lentisphaeria bacterium]|nr:glycosyltransferase [Lentisphaeria bacterium]